MSHLRSSSLFSVAGKRVLLTGGGRGIGKMMATGLVANGARVAIASRNQAALDEVVAELRGLDGGGECVALRADLSTRAGCEQLAADFAASSLGGQCDVLVNNSGVSWGEPLARESGRMNWGWDRVLDLNVKAPFYLTRAMLPQLGAASADGADARDPARVIKSADRRRAAAGRADARVRHLEGGDPPPHAQARGGARAARRGARGGGQRDRARLRADEDVEGPATWAPTRTCSRASSRSAAAAATPTWRAPALLASPAASWMTGVILPVDGGATGAARVEVLPDE